VPTLVPVLGKELSHVQFQSLEEQNFRTMAVLFDQQQRQGVVRLVGMTTPVSIRTPDVPKVPGSAKLTKKFLAGRFAKLDFALPIAVAQKQLADRAETLADTLMDALNDAPKTTKRRIR